MAFNSTLCHLTIPNITANEALFVKNGVCVCGQPIHLHPNPLAGIFPLISILIFIIFSCNSNAISQGAGTGKNL